MDWLKRKKDDNRTLDQYLKHHVPDAERRIYAARQKDFVLRRNLLYLRVTPKRSNKDVLVFVVLGLKRQAAIDGCHHYLGHQGRDRMLSLLKERFWWPGMAQRMMMSVTASSVGSMLHNVWLIDDMLMVYSVCILLRRRGSDYAKQSMMQYFDCGFFKQIANVVNFRFLL